MQAALPLMVIGSLVQGVAGYQSGQYNKKVANANARNAETEGLERATRIRNAGRIAMGRQIAAQGESGFEVGDGSAIDTLLESATNSEMEAMDAWREARARGAGFRTQGAMAAREGNSALVQGFFGAASAVAGAKADYAAARGG